MGEVVSDMWVYEGDVNVVMYLIRNSLVGGDVKMRVELVSFGGKVLRWM